MKTAWQGLAVDHNEQRGMLAHRKHAFVNPFQIEDLLIFDQENLCRVLASEAGHMTPEQLAWSMWGASRQLVRRVLTCLPAAEQPAFLRALVAPGVSVRMEQARHCLLDLLFWELTYWKTPGFYEELTAGECLHPGIFEQLEPWLRGKIVLDVGAGSGRATFEAARHGARRIYAVEPSPGLRQILRQKVACAPDAPPIVISAGDFAHLPLPARSVDLAMTCSAFMLEPQHGGEPGLAELRRVTRAGGCIVVIWPGPTARSWLSEHGFRYVALPGAQEMAVTFASWQSAWRCVHRFYSGNTKVLSYLLHARQPGIPFAVLGFNAPCDYCWLQVK